ncbi:hypothetical protein [Paenibacillus sp. CAA11]|uniref:hypothetical protein n=1 Tax=Paenibacillus sp. CAA11 TaxID=1532905 RepID=UPI0018FF62FE|nr:hypothetical protein [Paenibacillus sp. CAA11]
MDNAVNLVLQLKAGFQPLGKLIIGQWVSVFGLSPCMRRSRLKVSGFCTVLSINAMLQ